MNFKPYPEEKATIDILYEYSSVISSFLGGLVLWSSGKFLTELDDGFQSGDLYPLMIALLSVSFITVFTLQSRYAKATLITNLRYEIASQLKKSELQKAQTEAMKIITDLYDMSALFSDIFVNANKIDYDFVVDILMGEGSNYTVLRALGIDPINDRYSFVYYKPNFETNILHPQCRKRHPSHPSIKSNPVNEIGRPIKIGDGQIGSFYEESMDKIINDLSGDDPDIRPLRPRETRDYDKSAYKAIGACVVNELGSSEPTGIIAVTNDRVDSLDPYGIEVLKGVARFLSILESNHNSNKQLTLF